MQVIKRNEDLPVVEFVNVSDEFPASVGFGSKSPICCADLKTHFQEGMFALTLINQVAQVMISRVQFSRAERSLLTHCHEDLLFL